MLEELREWVGIGNREFSAIGEADIVAAVRSHRRSFELFHTWNDVEDRRRLLMRIPYGDIIGRAAERYRIDALLLAAVIEAESSFDPEAISPAGAMGLMQVMPTTAQLFGSGDPLNPATNVNLGARYLSYLLEEFDGDLELALAAYNAGPGNVQRYRGMPPFRETRSYVGRVLSKYVDHHQDVWENTRADEWLVIR